MLSIRRLGPDEWPEWRLLRRQALAQDATAFGSTLAEWSGPGDREDRWRERLLSVSANFVAVLEGASVGMASVTAVADGEAELISMWVSPSARHRGVGRGLVDAALAHARAQGARRVALDVVATNDAAIALYAGAGFVDVGWAAEPDDARRERRMVVEL